MRGEQFPGRRKSPNNVTSSFYTVHLLSKDLRFEHRDANLLAPGAIKPRYAPGCVNYRKNEAVSIVI